MSLALLLSAALAGAAYTLIPGPAFLALLGIGASRGRGPATGFLVGHFAGDILWATLSLVAIVGAHAIGRTFFDALGLVCGLYLCWLGVAALRATRGGDGDLSAVPKRPVLRGLAFGLTNPKAYPVSIAMFTALLSGSAETLGWSALPALLMAACVGFVVADAILIVVAGAPWVRRIYRRYDVWITRASGLIFIGFGVHALSESVAGLFARKA